MRLRPILFYDFLKENRFIFLKKNKGESLKYKDIPPKAKNMMGPLTFHYRRMVSNLFLKIEKIVNVFSPDEKKS